MNILLITDLYPICDNDNIPYAIENIALALEEYGWDITVIRPNFLINTIIRKHKIYPQKKYIRKGIEIYNKNFILPFIFDNFKPDKKYDVIISHMPSGHIYANLANKKLNLPHIAICHQSDLDVLEKKEYKFYFSSKLKKALNNVTALGARNYSLKEKLGASFILPSFIEKGNIVKNKFFNNEKLRIITLSQLIKRKNIDLVIKALANADFEFEYNIFGDGKEKNNLEKLIKKLNLENKVFLKGKIPHNKVFEELDKNDIFILPSVNETFGLSYFEAMARGLITIATYGTGMDGIIENNINGYLVKPNKEDILKILNKIKNNNQNEIIKNSILNIEKYEKKFVIKNYINVIESCLKK